MIQTGEFIRLTFRDLRDLSGAVQDDLLRIRNETSVREKMFSNHPILLPEHHRWIRSLKDDATRIVWAIFLDDQLIGAVSLANIDLAHSHADWAFYVTSNQQGSGVGGVVEYLLLEHVFTQQRIAKLNCQVLATNGGVVRMHKKFGFQQEGVCRQNIVKDNDRIDVVQMGMLLEEWTVFREKVRPLVTRIYQSLENRREVSS